ARLADRLGAGLADSVRAGVHPLDGPLDLGEQVLRIVGQCELVLARVGLGARVGLVVAGAVAGVALGDLAGGRRDLLAQALDLLPEPGPDLGELLGRPLVLPVADRQLRRAGHRPARVRGPAPVHRTAPVRGPALVRRLAPVRVLRAPAPGGAPARGAPAGGALRGGSLRGTGLRGGSLRGGPGPGAPRPPALVLRLL